MAEFGGALDSWLEAPYVDAERLGTQFEEWCEAEGVDPEAPDAWERFEEARQEPPEDEEEPWREE